MLKKALPQQDAPLLTTAELAERLKLSTWSIRALARSGRLPAIRLTERGKLLFDPEAISKTLRRRQVSVA